MSQKLKNIIDKNGSNFSLDEFDPAGQGIGQVQPELVSELTLFRLWIGFPMLLTSVYRDGDDGAHGHGLAGDFIVFTKWLEKPLDPWTLWNRATTWPFMGVGIYFDWKFTDKDGNQRDAVGIHADLLSRDQGKRPLRWIAKKSEGNNGDPMRHYYYQRPNGLFYAKDRPDPITLSSAIIEFEK